MKKYYWLKLKEDFFDDKTIKYLRTLPDGNSIVIVYLKMQLKSLKSDGVLKYDRIMPSSEEEMALVLEEDLNIVKLTIAALERVKAVERLDDNSFYMLAMQELIGKDGESTERVRRFRERQKTLHVTDCNAYVTKSNTELEKELDIELDKDKDKEIKLETDKTTKPNKTKKKATFQKPELKEVIEYIREKHYNVDPQYFYEYYTQSNWEDVKGNKIKNWKLKLLTWQKREEDKNPRLKRKPTTNKSLTLCKSCGSIVRAGVCTGCGALCDPDGNVTMEAD